MTAGVPSTATREDAVIRRVVLASSRWSAVLFLGLAVVLIAGGPARITSPSYRFVRELGGSYTWGAAFAVLAAIVALASLRWETMLVHALRLAAVAFLLFAFASVAAAFVSPIAGLTGIVTYTWVACWHIWVSSSARHRRRK